MFKIFKQIKTLLLIIVFMILAVVASINFGGDKNAQIRLKNSNLWQGANSAISFLLLGTESFSKLDFNTKFNFLKNNKKLSEAGLDELSFGNINEEFQEKLETIKLENKFSTFLSFFQDQFAKLDKESPEVNLVEVEE